MCTKCRTCEELFIILDREPETSKSLDLSMYGRYEIYELPESAKDGCDVCRLLCSKALLVKRSVQEVFHRKETFDFEREPDTAEDFRARRRLRKLYYGPVAPRSRSHGFLRLDHRRLTHSFTVEFSTKPYFFSLRPLSDASFSRVQSWINQCETEHSTCNARYDLTFWPTRIIDVGHKGQSPRLVETKALGHKLEGRKYLTLSHCWGLRIPDHATTKKSTLRDRLKRVPLSKLPKTFNEAIRVTRKLGIRYIWIDSICIIQDSISDWQQESALMGKVYANCFCMLAAANSKNCHGGLFQAPGDYAIMRQPRDIQDPERVGILVKAETPSWHDEFLKCPLNSRGWTLQERELSPRILYFMGNTIHFECRQARGHDVLSTENENGTSPLVSKKLNDTDPRLIRCMDPIFSSEGDVQWSSMTSTISPVYYNNIRFNNWLDMVEAYSERTLSVATDKFPALSGLAAEYSYLLRDDYVAGIWRKDLIRGLCWKVVPVQPRSRIMTYGPSWSWAKVAGPVTYDILAIDSHAQPPRPQWEASSLPTHRVRSLFLNDGPTYGLTVATLAEGNDPNGTLKSASIRMNHQMVPLHFQGRTTWRIGTEVIAIIWDMNPDVSNPFFLLFLGKLPAVLVVTPINLGKKTYARVGIAAMSEVNFNTWFKDSQRQEIMLI